MNLTELIEGGFVNTTKAWVLRVIYGVVSVWLAFVTASTMIKVMFYIAFIALPIWAPSIEITLINVQTVIARFTLAYYLFVTIISAVAYIKGLGLSLWWFGKANSEMVRYPILAVGYTILSSMLDLSAPMMPTTFFIVLGIAVVSYIVIKIVSAAITV